MSSVSKESRLFDTNLTLGLVVGHNDSSSKFSLLQVVVRTKHTPVCFGFPACLVSVKIEKRQELDTQNHACSNHFCMSLGDSWSLLQYVNHHFQWRPNH